MKNFDKRLSKLESVKPDKEYFSYGELLKLEATPGTKERKEFLQLYNENRNELQQTT